MATLRVGVPPNDPEVMLAEMRREEDDVRWVEDNMAALVQEYGIKFVAVRNRTVVAASPRLSRLLKTLRARGFAPGSTSIEVLYRQE